MNGPGLGEIELGRITKYKSRQCRLFGRGVGLVEATF